MENFTPIASTLGGMLIGLSATLVLILHGRIAGISGIVSGSLDPDSTPDQRAWRLVFLGGLVLGALPLLFLMPESFALGIQRSPLTVMFAGTLVGVGTRLGSGCTSGHGVCGISRGSPRSIVATVTFISAGILTVFFVNTFFGGRL